MEPVSHPATIAKPQRIASTGLQPGWRTHLEFPDRPVAALLLINDPSSEGAFLVDGIFMWDGEYGWRGESNTLLKQPKPPFWGLSEDDLFAALPPPAA